MHMLLADIDADTQAGYQSKIFLQGGPRGPPCFYRREHEAHFKLQLWQG